MFGNAQMGGVNIAFPDICLTPPVAVPIPYPNISLGPVGFPPAFKIFWMCTPSHNIMTMATNNATCGVMLDPPGDGFAERAVNPSSAGARRAHAENPNAPVQEVESEPFRPS